MEESSSWNEFQWTGVINHHISVEWTIWNIMCFTFSFYFSKTIRIIFIYRWCARLSQLLIMSNSDFQLSCLWNVYMDRVFEPRRFSHLLISVVSFIYQLKKVFPLIFCIQYLKTLNVPNHVFAFFALLSSLLHNYFRSYFQFFLNFSEFQRLVDLKKIFFLSE